MRETSLAGMLIALKGSYEGSYGFSPFVQALKSAAADGVGCQKPMAFDRGDGRKSDRGSHIRFNWY